jgi:signal transduction histidine kinase/CheY-like chemotaxis protein
MRNSGKRLRDYMRISKLLVRFIHKYRARFEAYGEYSSRSTFYGDLNYESGKIFYIVFITLFLMLVYLPGDIKIHPFPALAVFIHLGYTLISAVLIALRFTKRFRYKPGILLMALTVYFFIGTTVITASSGSNIRTYIGPLSVMLMLPVFAPFPIKFKLANIALTLVIFFSVAFSCGLDFSDFQTRYIINDLMVAVAVSLLFSITQDRMRRRYWEWSVSQNNIIREIKYRESLLNMVNNTADVLLFANDDRYFEAALLKSFKFVGDCMDADRVQIWRNEVIDGEMHFVRRYQWLSDYGRKCVYIPPGLRFSYKEKPEWEDLFLNGGYINSPFSKLSHEDQVFFAPYDLKSIAIIPIFLERETSVERRRSEIDRRQLEDRRDLTDNRQLFIYDRRHAEEDRRQAEEDRRQAKEDRRQSVGGKGSFWGFITINDCRKERIFSDEEVRILTSVGLMMSNAVNRNLQNNKIRLENVRSIAMTHWYESILNAIPLPISVTDENANWTFINTASEKFLDATLKNVLGKPCSNWGANICNTPECGIECVKKGIKKTYFTNEDSSYEVDVAILKDINNNPMGYVEIVHNVTNLKRMAKKQADAESANIAKSSFLARMSHEIRSPMNVILGLTEMQLENEGLPHDTREALGKVYSSGYLLLDVINEILDLSKIEADKLELLPVNYDVARLICDTVQLNVMRFDNKPIQFELRTDEHIPVTLFGDELRIKQILNNVITNAFKYTDSGKVSMSVVAEYKMSEQGEAPCMLLIFRISDTGRGMAREQVDKLFDEYTRFNLEANRTTEGTGLGMSIANRLVHLMNGEIMVESELNKGSTFTVKLPQGIVQGAGIFGSELAESINRFNYGKAVQIKKSDAIIREYMPYGKVLIVDDMEPNLYVARGLLSHYGLSIETALSGAEAIEKIKRGTKFDVIFMDHFMPVMDGIEAAKIIRDLGYTKPIVALTANALVGQAEMFIENGFDGFIPKPVDIRHLDETLNRLIRDRYPVETVEAARQLKENLKKNSNAVKMDLSYMKALVVDDFLPNLNVAAGMLRKYKIQVDCLLNGHEAVNRIKNGELVYDFIFMDHLMPDMDGIETTRMIRSIGTEYSNNIPIIALTGDISAKDAAAERIFLDNGFKAVLPKPLSLAKLDVFLKGFIREKITKNTNIFEKNRKEKKMDVKIPGVDQSKLMELYDGDLEIFLSVLHSYLSVMPATLEKMRSVSAETLKEYTIDVHGVKGTSESIGAEDVRRMAAELEALAKAGDISGVLAKNGALISHVEQLLSHAKAWLAQSDAK